MSFIVEKSLNKLEKEINEFIEDALKESKPVANELILKLKLFLAERENQINGS